MHTIILCKVLVYTCIYTKYRPTSVHRTSKSVPFPLSPTNFHLRLEAWAACEVQLYGVVPMMHGIMSTTTGFQIFRSVLYSDSIRLSPVHNA